jgi:hypothetical protein
MISHKSSDNVRRDFCDGEFFKNHPVFSVHLGALQFIVYYDDIEVANPLGSRAGNHKHQDAFTSHWETSDLFIGHHCRQFSYLQ